MPGGFPLQDTGPGMNELFHDLAVEQAENQAKAGPQNCSCYPGEGPLPCPLKGALRDCWRAAVIEETQKYIVMLKNMDREAHQERLLHFLKRVRCALELETSDFPDVGREPRDLR
jgi:hypothetical protein